MAKCKGKIVNQYTLENEFINQFKSICSSIKYLRFSYMRQADIFGNMLKL